MSKNVNFATLEQMHGVIMAVDAENDALHKALRAVNIENDYWGSANVRELQKLAYAAVLGDDKRLIDDFEYLLYEVPIMDDGGSITVDGKVYPIRKFEDLRRYWVSEEVVVDG